MAPAVPPKPHPKDAFLLRPLKELRRQNSTKEDISFLRRTQHISNEHVAAKKGNAAPTRRPVKRKPAGVNIHDRDTMVKDIEASFDLANPQSKNAQPDKKVKGRQLTESERAAWANPVHPNNPSARPVDFYPVLPDLPAMSDVGGFQVTRFTKDPTQSTDRYDKRLNAGLVRFVELTQEQEAVHRAKIEAHEIDPVNNPHPGNPLFDAEYFLPPSADAVPNIKKAFDPTNPDKENPALYNHADENSGEKMLRYERLRTYGTKKQTESVNAPYRDVALVLHDSTGANDQKAAYYYPIVRKQQLEPLRSKVMNQRGMNAAAGGVEREEVDFLDVSVVEPTEPEAMRRLEIRANYDSKAREQLASLGKAKAEEEGGEGEVVEEKNGGEDVEMEGADGGVEAVKADEGGAGEEQARIEEEGAGGEEMDVDE